MEWQAVCDKLTQSFEEAIFLVRWRVDGMAVDQARIHAKALADECRLMAVKEATGATQTQGD